nr:hypothetical protein [Corynebacterium sp. UBA5992]
MANVVSFGFPTPPKSCVVVEEFKVKIDDDEFPINSRELPNWDYQSAVKIIAIVNVDLPAFTLGCGFDPDQILDNKPHFGAQISWSSNKTKQRGASARKLISDGINRLEVDLDSLLLGGDLQAQIRIDLAQAGTAVDGQLTAERLGSKLWQSDVLRIRLEGAAAQMPITPIDFKLAALPHDGAMWRVEVSTELMLPVQAGLRIFLNTHNKTCLRMLENPNQKEKAVWDAFLQTDIMVQLLLKCGELAELNDFFESALYSGSLAETILNLASLLFPDTPLEDVPRDNSSLFSAAQALAFKDVK